MANPVSLGDAHTLMIKKHLDLVFKKVTPKMEELQDEKPRAFRDVSGEVYGGDKVERIPLTCSAGDIDYGEAVEYGSTTMPLSCSNKIGFL